jgi:hypothetical protein
MQTIIVDTNIHLVLTKANTRFSSERFGESMKNPRSRFQFSFLRSLACLTLSIGWQFALQPVNAQIDQATITGVITDAGGGVIPNVTVTAANVESGTKDHTLTNEAGVYQIRALKIGNYVVRFEKTGFTKIERTGLTLEAGQVAQVNASLVVGTVSEEITVTNEPVLLETENATVGTVIAGRTMEDLPLDISGGRDITNFVFNTVATTTGGNYVGHITGSQDKSKSVMVDGTDGTAGFQGFVQNVGMEAVQEMNVQVAGMNAEGSATGGGTILLELKSGTNKLHGSAFYYLENEALDANAWDRDFFRGRCAPGDSACRDANRTPKNRLADWGFSAGGPIQKNKTFLFGAWEHYRQVQLSFAPNQATVPTQAFMNGDFSALLGGPLHLGNDPKNPIAIDPCTGNPILSGQIYDPQAMFVNSAGVTCNVPFAGNIIPGDRITTTAKNIINKLYKNGYGPTNSGVINNFPAFTGVAGLGNEHFDTKLDHNISSAQRISVSYDWWNYPYTGQGGLWQSGRSTAGPLSTGLTQTQVDQSFRIRHFYTFRPTMFNAFSIVYNQHRASDSAPTAFDASTVGISGTNGKNFPTINFGSSVNGVGETNIGPPFSDGYVQYNRGVADTLSWVRGRHSFQFGGDFQGRGMNSREDSGLRTYNFSNTTGATLDPNIQPFVGFGFANFLLGDVQNGSQTVPYRLHGRRKRMGLYATDDFKVNRKLTINAGLRWDFNFRFHETKGQWANFDLNAQNPLWGGNKGAWTWAKNGSDSFEKNQDYLQFGPHLGIAYQLRSNLVVRGGYGINYTPLALNQWNGVPFATSGGAFGFIGSNQVVNNDPQAVGFQWDAGYPGKDRFPTRDITQTFVSDGVAYTWPNALHLGMLQNWNAGLQYQVSKDAVFSLTYLANHGSHLHDGSTWPFNFPTQAAYLKLYNSGHVNDVVSDPASAAAAGVPFPYPGFFGFAFQAIAPYPQVASFGRQVQIANSDLAVSYYRAMVAEIRTRGAHGLTADVNYTLSRSEGNASDVGAFAESWTTLWNQDPYNLKNLGHQVNDWNHTHEVKGYILYDLPFGTSGRWKTHSSALDRFVLGGWTIGTQLSYHSGAPMWAIANAVQYPGWDAVFATRNPAVSLSNQFKGFNPAWNPLDPAQAGVTDPNSIMFNPAAYTTTPNGQFSPQKYSIQEDLRGWAWANEDVSIVKRFSFGQDGRFRASLRAQFFDVFNRHHWNDPAPGSPTVDPNSPFFGHVTSVSGHRFGQLGARIEW